MKRAALGLVALVAVLATPAAAVQTFLPAGGYSLQTSAEVKLPLDTVITVQSTSAAFFFLASLEVSNQGIVDCYLRVELHNVSGAVSDAVIAAAPIQAGGQPVTVTLPIPAVSGATMGLGPETFEVYVTRSCNAAFTITAASYLLIQDASLPGATIGSINGESGFAQTLEADSDEMGFTVTSLNNVHSFVISLAGDGADSFCIGEGRDCDGARTTGIGTGVNNDGADTVLIGHELSSAAAFAVFISTLPPNLDGEGTVGVGYGLDISANCDDGVIIGREGVCDAPGIGIGAFVDVTGDCVCIGQECECASAGHIMLGNVGAADPVQLFLGGIQFSATPPDIRIQPPSGVGTNIAGSDTTIASSRGTGTGGFGSIFLQTGNATASGTNLGTIVNRWQVQPDGDFIPVANNAYDLGEPGKQATTVYAAGIRNGAGDEGIEIDNSGNLLPTDAGGSPGNIGAITERWGDLWADGADFADDVNARDTVNLFSAGGTKIGAPLLGAITIGTADFSVDATIFMPLLTTGTITLVDNLTIGALFAHGFTWTNPSTDATNYGSIQTLLDSAIFNFDTTAGSTELGYTSLTLAPTFDRTAGTDPAHVDQVYGISFTPQWGSGVETEIVYGANFYINGNNSVDDAWGVKIRQMQGVADAYGFDNESTTLFPPGNTQSLTANSDAFDATNNTTIVFDLSGNLTLTSTPMVTHHANNGQEFTILNVDASNTVTISDEGTVPGSGLRLSANTITLGPGDSCLFHYDATLADLIELRCNDVL